MKNINTALQQLPLHTAREVSGAGFLIPPDKIGEKPKLTPPRHFTQALGEDGGDFPEESIC